MKAYRHAARIAVRNYEVDWQGIVHNAVYLQYFETGRIEYLRKIGRLISFAAVRGRSRIVLARNEVDYLSPARFDDVLEVRTRIAEIGRTSFVFEGVIRTVSGRRLVARNRAVHVWLHPRTGRPTPVPESFRSKAERYEGRSLRRNIAE